MPELTGTPGGQALDLMGEVSKIGFVEFTTDLVTNVFETVVNSTLDQLRTYAEFVNVVSKSVAEYQNEVVGATEDEMRERADQYISEILSFSIPEGAEENHQFDLSQEQQDALRDHFAGITIDVGGNQVPIDDPAVIQDGKITLGHLRQFVIEKTKAQATDHHALLVTILKIGMQKLVVTQGEIYTRLTFHVDAHESASMTSSNWSRRAEAYGYGGGFILGMIGFGGKKKVRKINVSVVNERSSAAINVVADIIGGVKILFRTETYPTIEA